jgi:hypothetical protein
LLRPHGSFVLPQHRPIFYRLPWPLPQNCASAFICVAYLDIVFAIIGRKFISTKAAFQIRLQLLVGHTRGIISCFECDIGCKVSDLQEVVAITIAVLS